MMCLIKCSTYELEFSLYHFAVGAGKGKGGGICRAVDVRVVRILLSFPNGCYEVALVGGVKVLVLRIADL